MADEILWHYTQESYSQKKVSSMVNTPRQRAHFLTSVTQRYFCSGGAGPCGITRRNAAAFRNAISIPEKVALGETAAIDFPDPDLP